MQINAESKALLKQVMARLDGFLTNPWTAEMEPYQIIPNVYYVGNKYVGCYLFQTEKGLVLIDCAMQETAYLLLESIRKAGFDPKQVRTLFITHGHIDHCGAARLLQEYTGCEIYFPQGDLFFLTDRRDLILREERVPEFHVTGTFSYDMAMDFGNFRFRPVHTPGHTPGCTSFLIEADTKQETLLLGLHGGLGLNGLSLAELEANGLPLSLQQEYLGSLERIIKEPVDIVLPSHASHYPGDYFAIAAQNDGSGKALRVPGMWQTLIGDRIRQAKDLMERDAQAAG